MLETSGRGSGEGFAATEKSAALKRRQQARLKALELGQSFAPQMSLAVETTGRNLAVEKQKYVLPSGYGTLAKTYTGIKDVLTQMEDFHDLPELAREMGFVRTDDIATKKGGWHIFERLNHEVPNFPSGVTVIDSTLAIYATGGELTQPVLRTSLKPHSQEELRRDLDIFTKHYIERPAVWGFPSSAMTNILGLLPTTVVAMAIGGAIGYETTGTLMTHWLASGDAMVSLAYVLTWWASERFAKNQISTLSEYSAGRNARDTLLSERYHISKVAIQKEVFAALRTEAPDLSPEQFLNKIYAQLPPDLIQKRAKEVEMAQYSKQFPVETPTNTGPALLGIARVLAAA